MAGHDDYPLKEYKHLFCSDLLAGKVAFVSGGGSGIGFRIAELLLRHGCCVTIASRKIEKLEQVETYIYTFDIHFLFYSQQKLLIKQQVDSVYQYKLMLERYGLQTACHYASPPLLSVVVFSIIVV